MVSKNRRKPEKSARQGRRYKRDALTRSEARAWFYAVAALLTSIAGIAKAFGLDS